MALEAESSRRSSSSSTPYATLDDLRLFLSHVSPGERMFYSADIGVGSVSFPFCITMKRRYESTSRSCHKKEETSRTFDKNLDFLEVIRTMADCPTWTRGDFVFYKQSDFVPELDDLMLQLFSILGSCSSLTTLDIMFYRFYHTHLPRLLGELRFLKTLILDTCPMSLPEHEQSIAQYFEQNTTLESCTLVFKSCDLKPANHSSLGTVLKPLTNGAALQELVLRITPSKDTDLGEEFICEKLVCENCHKAIADVVRSNNSLVKFELCCSYSRDEGCALVGSALEVNRSLQEFGFPCSVAGLKELVRSLSGPKANLSLTTLKLIPRSDCRGLHFMNELARLLESNNTLKVVHVPKQSDGNSWPFWESQNLTAARHVESSTWKKLKSMMDNELKSNTSLNSLVVGNWKLLRVDTGWDLSYGGPCLSTMKHIEDYIVHVKIQQ